MYSVKKQTIPVLTYVFLGLLIFASIDSTIPNAPRTTNKTTHYEIPNGAAIPFSVSILDSCILSGSGFGLAFVMKVTSDGNLAVIMENTGALHFLNLTDVTAIEEIATYERSVIGYGDLAFREDYMYVTSVEEDHIEIFNIADPRNPINLVNISHPDPYGIDIKDSYAYVGEYGPGMRLWEVNLTNPTNPVNVTNVSLAAGSQLITNVEVFGNYAFARGEVYPVYIVDISDPLHLVARGNCSFGQFTDFTVSGNRVYTVYTSSPIYYVYVFDTTDPDNPTALRNFGFSHWGFDLFCADVVGACLVVGSDDEIIFLSTKEPFSYDESKFLVGTYSTGTYILEVQALPQPGLFLTYDINRNVTLFQSPNCVPLPGAPQNAVGSIVGSDISLIWQSPNYTGGVSVSGYNIYRTTTSGGSYGFIGNSSGLNYTDTSGTAGMTYYYVITAINTGGESVYSNEVAITFPNEDTPIQPSNSIPGYPIVWTIMLGMCVITYIIHTKKIKQNMSQ
ncbi:MAG: putative protease [Promethearchaeota archaeon CR_4]|nr:MAG: putative protease [Candidatus Lokiarchaeota archaeon CR_4]